jgi:hypothetical protein
LFLRITVLTLEEDEVLTRLAREISEGCREAGETPNASKNDFSAVEGAELVFLGFTAHRKLFWSYASERALRAFQAPETKGAWQGKRVALFAACYGEAARSAMNDAVKEANAVGAKILNTIALVAEKNKQGGWDANETDLARARGFGERTTNNAKGVAVFRGSEKHRIKKYLK